MAKIVSPWRFSGGQEEATNGLVAVNGLPVAIKNGYVDKAVAWDKVEWLSAETKTFASDNQSTVREKLQFIRLNDETQVEIEVGTGTIVEANRGELFDLGTDGTIDATATTPSQLILREFISSTKGVFVRAK